MKSKELTPEEAQEIIEKRREYRWAYYRLHRERRLYKKNHKPKPKKRYFEVVMRGYIFFKME